MALMGLLKSAGVVMSGCCLLLRLRRLLKPQAKRAVTIAKRTATPTGMPTLKAVSWMTLRVEAGVVWDVGVELGVKVVTICVIEMMLVVDDVNELEVGVAVSDDCEVMVTLLLSRCCIEITSVLVDTKPLIPIIVCAFPSASEKVPSPVPQLHLPA